jgi:hypothetical protein
MTRTLGPSAAPARASVRSSPSARSTIGRQRGSLGVAYQRSKYDTFEGKNLRQREIKFYIQHTDCCGRVQNGAQSGDGSLLNPAFEGDIIEAALALNLTTDTVVFSGGRTE